MISLEHPVTTDPDKGDTDRPPAFYADPEDVNRRLVRHSLHTMAEELTRFRESVEARFDGLNRLIVGRFNDMTRQLEEHAALIGSVNQLLSGLRSQTKSAYDVAISAQREVRRTSNIPSDEEEHATKQQRSLADPGSDPKIKL